MFVATLALAIAGVAIKGWTVSAFDGPRANWARTDLGLALGEGPGPGMRFGRCVPR